MSRWILLKSKFKAAAAQLGKRRGEHVDHNEIDDQTPLHAELFSVDQMERHGEELANRHVVCRFGAPDWLLKRLDENERILIRTCRLLTVAIKAKKRIAPAGEWLLDNFYLIEELIRTARRHLPKGYSRELPCLAEGPSAGLPRVYDLALEVISHSDGRVDEEILRRFVAAYQEVTALTLGELWAIPIMLRLALIENLRRVGERITAARIHVNLAHDWANQMMTIAASDPKSLILVIADMARSNPPMTSSFVAELSRRLQGHGPALALPLTWIEQALAESSRTIEQMVRSENQQQATDQVSISNAIGSLRSLGAMDWRVFVESMSVVEKVLLKDIGGIYGAMDFATRDRYRLVIDRLAKRSLLSEIEVASAAIALAQCSVTNDDHDGHTAHVGFYLIDRGLSQLEDAVRARRSVFAHVRGWFGRFPFAIYFGSIMLMTAVFTAVFLALTYHVGENGWRIVLLGSLSFLAFSQLAVTLVNWISTLLIAPSLLPRLDFSKGLPPAMRTLVVIPTLLGGEREIDGLLEALEVRFLGNQDPCLHFCLLTDYRDAQTETVDEDERLLGKARIGIENLNKKYHESGSNRFFLLHRPRLWNPSECVWMGFERKRGKLADLNALLRGNGRDRFSLVIGDMKVLSEVKYVITLDTDTQLPRDSAWQLIGAMAHPLNRPRFDQHGQRVCGGYGILQPGMSVSLTSSNRSRYARLYGSEPGIDPYTRSVSDIYQDVFGEGSFIGKGIYDVDAFERVLGERFPVNTILSHDLLEGCYARSGLLSDVHLYEEYPARYEVDMKRQERWIRGDWQIAQWLLPRLPGPNGRSQPNVLSTLSRWKIFDNLRRSLVPAALLLLLLLGWWLMPRAGLWTLMVLGIVLIPPMLIAVVGTFRPPAYTDIGQHLASVLESLARNLGQVGLRISCLPHEAIMNSMAILRSLWRMVFTHRGLLVWHVATNHAQPDGNKNGAGEQDRRDGAGAMAMYRYMWAAPLFAVIAPVVTVSRFGANALLAVAPVVCLWFAAPAIVGWLSRPLQHRAANLTADQLIFLRMIARKTWAFFEHFVTAEEHWLPPDNFQEHPDPVIAHRTSPTNMGMALLANLSACDFGYISAGKLIERTRNAFGSMARLSRYQGHFYNWYDTQSLQPLPPRYVSSVDSGNLAGHLLTLRAALLELPDQAIVAPRLFEGIKDTLAVLSDTISDTASEAVQKSIARISRLVSAACAQRPATLPAVSQTLEDIADLVTILAADSDVMSDIETRTWASALQQQCCEALNDLKFLAPWLGLPTIPDDFNQFSDCGEMPTLRDLESRTFNLLLNIDMRFQEAMKPGEQLWLTRLRPLIVVANERATERIESTKLLARQATDFSTMAYAFMYDCNRHLLAIGYNVDEFRRDTGFYDLLASESRLGSFIAIAQGKLPQESWFALGRLLTRAGGAPILLSWSGSMFEYLMPLLVMPSYDHTLLDQTCRAAVTRQIAYGRQRALPWGVSESGYNMVDSNLNYRYHAFGVPGLGLKRGLADDLVVAPYAAALALMVAPEVACANLQKLSAMGLQGRYGFYEAIDYTPARLLRGQASVVVRSFMAHHQSMTLLSLAYLILDRPMQRRFSSDPLLQSTLLLLQEKIPMTSVPSTRVSEQVEGGAFSSQAAVTPMVPLELDTPNPVVQLLSNGRYHIMLTNAGGGYSRWQNLDVTRWREDSTCDNWGTFVYLRDVDSGEFWSAAHQPTCKPADSREAMFCEGRAEYRRRDYGIETYSEVVVSPEDDIELRRLRITNRSLSKRTIEITSYAEVVLAPSAADAIQPSFNKLFVQTEIIGERRAILCTRRPRSKDDPTPFMFHLLAVVSQR